MQNGDGYVDNEAKMKNIKDSIAAALAKWCCIDGTIMLPMYAVVCILAIMR